MFPEKVAVLWSARQGIKAKERDFSPLLLESQGERRGEGLIQVHCEWEETSNRMIGKEEQTDGS